MHLHAPRAPRPPSAASPSDAAHRVRVGRPDRAPAEAACGGRAGPGPIIRPTMPPASPPGPATAADVAAGLRAVGYLPDEATALVAFLATKLGKPVLVEGPAGVGKTELAKAL